MVKKIGLMALCLVFITAGGALAGFYGNAKFMEGTWTSSTCYLAEPVVQQDNDGGNNDPAADPFRMVSVELKIEKQDYEGPMFNGTFRVTDGGNEILYLVTGHIAANKQVSGVLSIGTTTTDPNTSEEVTSFSTVGNFEAKRSGKWISGVARDNLGRTISFLLSFQK